MMAFDTVSRLGVYIAHCSPRLVDVHHSAIKSVKLKLSNAKNLNESESEVGKELELEKH
jgi:hypothetical protein